MPRATLPALTDLQGTPRVLRIPLSARLGVAAEARARTADWLDDTTERAVVADVVLLVSELIGNAVRHAGAPGALLLVRDASLLRIEVTDSSPRPPRPRPTHHPADPGGLGLFLLGRLALRWGWYRNGPGKAVWCEVFLPPPRPSAAC
ncbi:ATP-binding protein [Kitasatospora sp. NPDC057692]|uniref:ATP-binding protein n=1 Tax=Kitasatospora sp. NPDC057692 TaxID=3346215 RepID=UPI003694A1A8